KNGLVKTLIGAETLGSTSVICTDKTGTLTEGVMKMEEIRESDDEERALLALALANEAVLLGSGEIKGESTDRSKLEYFLAHGGDMEKSVALHPRRALLPFNQATKCILSFHQRESEKIRLFVTGVPEYILDRSTKNAEEKERVHHVIAELAGRGFRLIGIAERELTETALDFEDTDILRGKLEQVRFLGIAAIRDPIRKDVGASLVASREAGIRTIVITGDHPLTAQSIGRELGFVAGKETLLTGQQLDLLSEEDLSKKIETLEIIARATPEHKMRIIAALKKRGDVVAMTGDGVNDAPALKAADVGVALGSGTDVTKEAADLVLIDDGFSTITEAIRQGRVAFDNIRKVVIFLLANSFTELIIVLIPLIFKVPLPITAVQVLWANMVEDGLPNFAFAFEHGEPNIMKRKPIAHDESIINRYGWAVIFLQGIVTDILVVAVYFLYLEFSGFPIEHIRSLIFAIIATDSLLFVFSIKSSGQSIFKTDLLDNKYLLGAVGVGFLLMFASLYAPVLNRVLETVPLRPLDIVVVLSVGVLKIVIIESIKWYFRRKNAAPHSDSPTALYAI
ncbi:MAG: HAD-IC family P-type ATPase, partial [Patescibacteria group bacterium]